MKLIVGIGNPDPEYQNTRHNVGWLFLDWLKKKFPVFSFQFSEKMNAEIAEGKIEGIKVSFVKPHTYVNKTGDAVKKITANVKLKTENIIVVQDDLDIPFGNCKLSFDRNSGGHKGAESIIKALKTTKFYRIRIGLGVKALDKARQQGDEKRDTFVRDFVLKPFSASEQETLKGVFTAAEVRLLQALKQ